MYFVVFFSLLKISLLLALLLIFALKCFNINFYLCSLAISLSFVVVFCVISRCVAIFCYILLFFHRQELMLICLLIYADNRTPLDRVVVSLMNTQTHLHCNALYVLCFACSNMFLSFSVSRTLCLLVRHLWILPKFRNEAV